MRYKEALTVKPGDIVSEKDTGMDLTILSVEKDDCGNNLFFRCKDGNGRVSTYHHTGIRSLASIDELVNMYLKRKSTRVRIHHNNELGKELYSVEVVNSGGFWLGSFHTEQEAEEYIKDNGLKRVGE